MLIGADGIRRLRESAVAVFGIGGVGSFVAEALSRAGVGRILLVDADAVAASNINRQLLALHSTVGRRKVDVMRERILDINPEANVETYDIFYTAENADAVPLSGVDYIVDAIDTVSSKLYLIERAGELKIPIICSMGTGNKLHPEKLKIADIYDTTVCPLARAMRTECKKRGIKKLKVVYSDEYPVASDQSLLLPGENRRHTPGSISFVPSSAGLMLAGAVVRDLLGLK